MDACLACLPFIVFPLEFIFLFSFRTHCLSSFVVDFPSKPPLTFLLYSPPIECEAHFPLISNLPVLPSLLLFVLAVGGSVGCQSSSNNTTKHKHAIHLFAPRAIAAQNHPHLSNNTLA
eukprot:m.95814 g.95814  ORF g.95814 m.95814 type:complete len:118 (+) comp13912_c0_seq4:1084-1437(+)